MIAPRLDVSPVALGQQIVLSIKISLGERSTCLCKNAFLLLSTNGLDWLCHGHGLGGWSLRYRRHRSCFLGISALDSVWYFLGLPPLIGLFSTWGLWKPNEALAGLFVQALLWVGALWAFEASGLGDLKILFTIFCAINGVLMAPAMIKEKQDEVNEPQSENSD